MTQPRSTIATLTSCLSKELELYQSMESYLHQKRDAIIEGNLDELMRIDNHVDELSQAAKQCDLTRHAWLRDEGLNPETPLTIIINQLTDPTEIAFLQDLRLQLRLTTEQIRQLSQVNSDLLKQSIRFVEESIELITSVLVPEGASYGHNGKPLHSSPINETVPTSTICRDG